MRAKRHLKTLTLASACIVVLCLPGAVFGRTFYVDDDAAGAQDGTCWTGAFKYLQDALAVVVTGDEIRVAQGEYRPDRGGGSTAGDPNATFRVPDGVAIKGGFAGVGAADPDLRDSALFATILTGDLAGNDDPNHQSTWSDNSFPVVTADGVSHDTVLEGLTIAHAYDYRKREAALYNEGGNLVVRDCTFRDNGADSGSAGVYNHQGNLRIEHCRFTHNWTANHAAALHNDQGSVEVIASEFVENECDDGTSGVLNHEGQAVFFGCLFRANRSASGMGVLSSIHEMSRLSLLYCTFIDNSALENTAGVGCGGRARIANCLFSGNRGEVGALKVGGCVSLEQCTFYGNSSWGQGKEDAGLAGALRAPDTFRPDGGAVTACGCIFWGNRHLYNEATGYEAQITGDPNLVTLEYCCIEGWTSDRGGLGNIGVDPLFVAPDQNDFHLKSQAGHWDAASVAWVADDVTSPCIDAGDPNAPVEYEPFPNGGRVNLGAYGDTCEASKSWFGAEPGPGVEAADLNGDGQVDAEDYRLALQRWPQAEP